MTPAAVIVLAALVAAALSPLWERWHARLDAVRKKRALCDHVWGEVYPLETWYGVAYAYKQFCGRGCGEQRDCNKDGTEYVPRGRRRR